MVTLFYVFFPMQMPIYKKSFSFSYILFGARVVIVKTKSESFSLSPLPNQRKKETLNRWCPRRPVPTPGVGGLSFLPHLCFYFALLWSLFLPGEMRRLLVYGGDSCLRSDRGGAELGRRKSEAGTTASRSKWYS